MAHYIDYPPPIPPGALSYFDAYPRALAAAFNARFEQTCTLLLLPQQTTEAHRLLADLTCPPPE